MSEHRFKYFDLQVNGYAGVDFNSIELSEKDLIKACKELRTDNVEGILATFITDDFEKLIKKIKNISSLIEKNSFLKSVIKGIHIEGPFLNREKGYRGAHPEKYIIPASIDKTKRILDAGNGLVKLVTLAPENDSNFEVVRYLSLHNVVVSAGHSNASLNQLNAAIDNGLVMFTHLGNGVPNILPRHNNIVNRVLSLSEKLFITFIADCIHVPQFVLKNYLKICGPAHSIIVTDAIAAASAPPGKYSISHINVEVGNDRIVKEVGKNNLAGSAVTMQKSAQNLYEYLQFSETEIEEMTFKNPKKAIGIS